MNGLQTANNAYIVQSRRLFHCQIRIKIPLYCGESLLDKCFLLMDEIDRKYNSYQPGSYIDQINKNAGQWVEVDNTTIHLLHILKEVSALTDGAYDITAMPLIRLWGFYKQENAFMPSAAAITDTLSLVNYQHMLIDNNRVKIAKNQEIITGSFIKAYAVDQVISYLQHRGIEDAIINAGGSTIMALNNQEHPYWQVDIPDAFEPDTFVKRLPIANQCFSLSGKLHNHICIDNKKYGHIIHAKTGWPAATAQVGLLSPTAFMGDVLSTAIFAVECCKVDAVIANLRQHFNFDYYRIEDNGQKIQSKCF